MPFALMVVGIVLIVTAVRDTQGQLFDLVKGDFTGDETSRGYLTWFFAIAVIGSVGYVEKLKPLSQAFLILVIVVLFLKNGGVFAQLEKELTKKPQPTNGVENIL